MWLARVTDGGERPPTPFWSIMAGKMQTCQTSLGKGQDWLGSHSGVHGIWGPGDLNGGKGERRAFSFPLFILSGAEVLLDWRAPAPMHRVPA